METLIPSWQRIIAYTFIAAPLAWAIVSSSPSPISRDEAIHLYVLLGFAVGAGLFIVRRNPDDMVGWLGLGIWGGLCLLAVVARLVSDL